MQFAITVILPIDFDMEYPQWHFSNLRSTTSNIVSKGSPSHGFRVWSRVQFLNDMAETMYDAPVLACSTSIGATRRILVADPSNNDDADAPTLFKMVNPKIISKSASLISYEESCLSVPEFYLNVNV